MATGYKDMMDLEGSLSRYVDIEYEYVTTDYTKGIGGGRVKSVKIPAKDCTAEDLELDDI